VGTQKLCACDRTCQSLICAEIKFVDTVKQSFAVIVKNLCEVNENGLWLNPFRGIPRGPRLSRFDVIYLDENCQVLALAENFIEAEFEPFHGEAASALILSPHAIGSLQIRKRDQLMICKGTRVLAPSEESELSAIRQGSQCVKDLGLRALPAQTSPRQQPSAIDTAAQVEFEEEPSFVVRLLRCLFRIPTSADRRKRERLPAPGLAAYYWTGGEPKAYQLGNVSQSGLYLLTDERWRPGTRIVMTLQKGSGDEVGSEKISQVESKVVRWGEDGVGCEFVQSGFVDLNTGEIAKDRKFDQEAFAKFLQSSQRGDSGAHHSKTR
jgi:hypothetical protein